MVGAGRTSRPAGAGGGPGNPGGGAGAPPGRRARGWAVAGAFAAALVTGACGDGEDRPNQVEAGSPATGRSPAGTAGDADSTGPPPFTAEEADTVVQVQLRDFGFFGIPQKVRGPKVLFVAANAGPAAHEMEVSDAGGRVLAGVEPFPAGESRTLAAELVPGTYTVQCRVKQGALSHVDFGMVTTVAVE